MGWKDAPIVEAKAPAAPGEWKGAPAVEAAPAGGPAARSGLLGAVQTLTGGFADEIQGLLAALPSAPADPDGPMISKPAGDTFAERYRNERDAARGVYRQAREDNPKSYLTGQLVAGVPVAAALPSTVLGRGAPIMTRVVQGARSAAPLGAVYGAGESRAETLPELAVDAGTGAALGAVAGSAGPLVGEGLRWAANTGAGRLAKTAIEQGRKALSGIGTPLSARKPIPEAAVQEALDSGAIRPLGTVTGTEKRLRVHADTIDAEYQAILRELQDRGVTGPNAVLLAQQIRKEAKEALSRSLQSSRPPMLASAADELVTKVDPTPFASKRLPLDVANDIKRGLQQEARREYDKTTRQYTTIGETKKELAAIVRKAIDDAVAEQADKAPGAAAAFEPVKARLSNTLEALKHAEEGAARAARRKPVSLTSTIVGSAAGSAAGSPIVGALTAMGHGIADSRLASTLASGANTGARLLSLVPRASPPGRPVNAETMALLRYLEERLAAQPRPAVAEDR